MDRIYVESEGTGRGFWIVYDIVTNTVVIDGVTFSPEAILMITRPDPTRWIRLERGDDGTVTGHSAPFCPADA